MEVTCRNLADEPSPGAVFLFCLQAGTTHEFHDYDAEHTHVWVKNRFITVRDLIGGRFEPHWMVRAEYDPDGAGEGTVARKVMVKRSRDTGFVLAIAADRCDSVSANFNISDEAMAEIAAEEAK